MSELKSYLIAILALVIVALSTCNGCKSARIAKLENQLQVCNDKPQAKPSAATVATIIHDTIPVIVPVGEGVTLIPSPKGHVVKTTFPPVPTKSGAVVDTTADVSCAEYGRLIWRYAKLLGHYNEHRVFFDTGKIRGVSFRNTVYTSNNYVDSVRTDIDSLPKYYVTNTIFKERKSVKGYLTMAAQGNRYEPLQAFGGGFMLQLKSNNAFEGQVLYNLKTPLPDWSHTTFQVSYKHFLTFRKF